MAESYEMLDAGSHALVKVGGPDTGEVYCWEQAQLAVKAEPAQGMPEFVRNGAYHETVGFISALIEGRMLHPSPAEVFQSVELCHRISQELLV